MDKMHVSCGKCSFAKGANLRTDLTIELALAGGYLITNEFGKYESMCPECGNREMVVVLEGSDE